MAAQTQVERDVQQLRSALNSMMDVVLELCQGLAHGQTPEPDWADIVSETFREHRRELGLPS